MLGVRIRQLPLKAAEPRLLVGGADGVGGLTRGVGEDRGLDLPEHGVAGGQERGAMLRLDRLAGRLAAAFGDRIDELAVLEEAEVQVRTRGGAGRADPPDDLILIDRGPGADAGRE